jgi:methylglyoxal/glyoxal reductase
MTLLVRGHGVFPGLGCLAPLRVPAVRSGMSFTIHDTLQLNSGRHIPLLGFGTWKLKEGDEVRHAVATALKTGYRHIDTASAYENEHGVGRALRESGLAREEIFLTTKVWNDDIRAGASGVIDAARDSLKRLGTPYVDLLLLHWPIAGKDAEAWKAMEQLYHDGVARSIGVSNYLPHHLDALLQPGVAVQPMINQVEFHPFLLQPELADACRRLGIARAGWSPLMQGKITEVPAIVEIAKAHRKTPAQIVLHWDLQHQVVTIPRSSNPQRIADNAALFDFELSPADIAVLDQLDRGQRFGPDPDHFDF